MYGRFWVSTEGRMVLPDGVVVDAELFGDGVHRPVLGVEQAADLGALRGRDHGRGSRDSGPPTLKRLRRTRSTSSHRLLATGRDRSVRRTSRIPRFLMI